MRLAVTYLVVASGIVYASHRLVRRIGAWAVVLLVFLPMAFLGEAFLNNGVYAPLDIAYRWEPLASYRAELGVRSMRTPLLADVVYQHLPWRKAVREALKNGRLP